MTPVSLHALDNQPLAALPVPTRVRWQPLRLGLVELFHYDCEEFWFRDGHLLLRGNNGTGKSKVLSLTLPFLLDANLSASRVEPDGDRSKRMEWNLLLGRHERRLGYSWIEFGRLDDHGQAHYVTLGCGIQAVSGRGRVDSWNFMTTQRVGEKLALITPRRNAISRDALEEALGDDGRVFKTAHDYRRAVDEQLFRLGERYDALIDTLIQLRQPQLSKKPDEQSLSEALTNALPELPRVVMEDVADAMTQLNVYRDELAQIEDVLASVAKFDKRYRVYAQIQARRQARVLRRVQTEYDNQSRELNEAQAQLERSQIEVQRHDARYQELDRELRRQRSILEELQADPAMQDARRLADLEQQEKSGERELKRAVDHETEAASQLGRDERERAQRETELSAARAELERSTGRAGEAARQSGRAREHDALMAPVMDEANAQERAELERAMRELARRREEQLAQIRRRLATCDQAERERALAQDRSKDRRATLERAELQARAANQDLEATAAQLMAAYRAYLRGLRVLHVDDAEDGLVELQGWVETMSGGQPLLLRLGRARRDAELRLASEHSLLDRAKQDLDAEEHSLRTEEATLREGNQLTPVPLPSRDVARRPGRDGAPFWQLLEFRDHIAPSERAGLEAALEASGLLDAWVTPQGEVLNPDSSDAFLRVGIAQNSSLHDWLLPADGAPVERRVIEALLASVGCARHDDGGADSWLSPQGQFRLGRLHGNFHKAQAQYVGWAAREAARHRRLLELETERARLQAELSVLARRFEALEEQQQRLADELRDTPSDEPLRSAHARFGAFEEQRREAQERLAEAETSLERSERRLREARAELEADARDLQLPTDPAALSEVGEALVRYLGAAQAVRHALEARARCASELERQRQRELRAHEELASRSNDRTTRARELADTQTRLALLRETALEAVTELQRRLSSTVTRVRDGDAALQLEHTALGDARDRKGSANQLCTDAQELLESRSAQRQQAAERLQGFAATGLLALALPELEVPERSVWSVDASLNLARRMEERLVRVAAEDHDWTRVQSAISDDYTELGRALSALGQSAQMEPSDFGLIVQILHKNRPERPDVLERLLTDEVDQRRGILSAKEREVFENYMQSEVAAQLQRLLRDAEARVERINQELKRRPTSTGVYFHLDWEPLSEIGDGAPIIWRTPAPVLSRRRSPRTRLAERSGLLSRGREG